MFRRRSLVIALLGCWITTGCASLAISDKPADTANKVKTDKPESGPLKPFAEVIKDATPKHGFFPIWEKDDKVWLEIPTYQLDQPFFFLVNRTHGTGERGVYASQMEDSYIASFHRIGDRIQLIAHNKRFFADESSPQIIAVHQGFSDSLLAASTVQSQISTERQSFLIDANALLLSDIPAGAYLLESAYRLPYAFDPKQSAIVRSRADPDITAVQVTAHFNLARLPLPNPSAPNTTPRNLQDPRSAFIGYHYSFSRLPDPMPARRADDRLGHFVTTRWNFGNDQNPVTREYFVNRWRLEKSDPSASLSEPKQPIVYWLDQNIPLAYRAAISEGVLAWNKAFEKIGFKNAIVVKQQQPGDTFDTMEARRASIRWFVGSDVGFAIGPSKVDPRTGEILAADIGLSDVFARYARRFFREERPDTPPPGNTHDHSLCQYSHAAAEDMHFSLDLLEARGELTPGSEEESRYVNDVIRDVVMHEVGHTLGLRHNFRASTVYNEKHLGDKLLSSREGIASSVMDYTPVNLALKGEPQGAYKMHQIGPYDEWAIEYAYRPLAPEEEARELSRIAGRSTEPLLTFATDEDAGETGEDGFDPDSSRFDLGNDPLSYFEKRAKLTQELWEKLQNQKVPDGESYARLRRTMEISFGQWRRSIDIASKYIGGLSHVRDHAGTGRSPLTPLDAATQRHALQLLTQHVFAPASFSFRPDFLRKLTPDYLDRHEAGQRIDIDINERILALQQQVLGKLYRDVVAARILDYGRKVEAGTKVFTLPELYDGLQRAIWQEAIRGGDPDVSRRTLQREHLKLLAKNITRANAPADVVALSRDNARELIGVLQKAEQRGKLSRETRVHYADAISMLQEALKAGFNRSLG